MSLDVFLYNKVIKSYDGGQSYIDAEEEVFWANITHNLGEMAATAGIYYHLWRPSEINITKAKDLIQPLSSALKSMKENPDMYEKFNAKNGWGLYIHFVPWIEKYLEACKENPQSLIRVSR